MPSPAEAGSPAAHALYREAQAQRESGRLASAEACFRKALHLFHREGALAQAMKALSGIASTQELKGRLPLALRTQRWILRLCADGSRIEGRFWALCDMAFLLMRLGQAAEAKARLSEAVPLLGTVCPEREPAVHYLMANIEFSLGGMEAAERHLGLAACSARNLEFPGIEGLMLAEMAQLLAGLGRTWEARELLKEALPLVQAGGDDGAHAARIRARLQALAPAPAPMRSQAARWPAQDRGHA